MGWSLYKHPPGFDGGCNFYTFNSTDTDSLQLGLPFTGNLKVLIKAPSEAGLHPDIIAGRQGAFVADTWVQYEIEAVALTYIVDATFNGRVAYAKDNVWFNVDMGIAGLRYYYDFDGVGAYIATGGILTTDVTLTALRSANTKGLMGGVAGSTRCYLQTNDNFEFASTDGTALWSGALSGINVGEAFNVELAFDGVNAELMINGNSKGQRLYPAIPVIDFVCRPNLNANHYDMAVYNLTFNGGGEYNINVDDGPLAGGVLANTGIGGDMVLVNEVTGDWYESDI